MRGFCSGLIWAVTKPLGIVTREITMGRTLIQSFEDSYAKFQKANSWLLGDGESEWNGPDLQTSIESAAADSQCAPSKDAPDDSEFIQRFCRLALAATASELLRPCTMALSCCESPIERVFLCALWLAAYQSRLNIAGPTPAVISPSGIARGNAFQPNSLTIEPQAKHGSFRVDFRLTYITETVDPPPPDEKDPIKRTFKSELIIECDGHDFHEKTKQQAAKDKSRDRDLQSSGVTVFHFTGSEIWNDPMECARQVVEYLDHNSRG